MPPSAIDLEALRFIVRVWVEESRLRWSDQELDGDGFVKWRRFEHPQLGPVEIGGFDLIRYYYNVPFDRLEKEVAPHSEWLVRLGLATPRIAVRSFEAAPVGANLWRLRLVVENTGWLPTNGSQQALDQLAVGAVTAELSLPAGVKLVEGAASRSLGQLAGRSIQRSTASWWGYTPGTPDRGSIDRYVNPNDPMIDPGNAGFNPNVEVLAVRVWIRVRAERPENGFNDGTTYAYAGQSVGPFNDGFRRLVVSKTIYLRNARPAS